MGSALANASVNTTVRKTVSNTLTGLKRWSCVKRDLPGVSEVKAIHIYDFDNTLFKSPLPNSKLWAPSTVGLLHSEDCFANGGWWHDQHILEATGEGAEKEELRAWEDWWNEHIVELVNLSLEQKDALTVLLTGRRESNFAGIIKRMVASKNLSFDMICLKPQAGPNSQLFTSTMMFKQALLQDIMYTYKDADEITVYEDRVKHVEGFRKFFDSFNKTLISPPSPTPRRPITAKVIQVAELATTLDPVTEAAEIQRMVNSHNAGASVGSRRYEIKRTVFYTGYLFSPADSAKLLNFVKLPPGSDSDFKLLADKILISHRLAPNFVLNKIGGIGHKQTWQVTGTACYESQIWAARVAPVPPTAPYHTDTGTPLVILALRKDARPGDAGRIQNWQSLPTEKQYIFQTVVGEKVQLRVERENDGENDNDSPAAQRAPKRRHPGIDESQAGGDSYRPGISQSYRGSYGNDDNRRPGPGGGTGSYRGGNQNRGRGGGNGPGGGNMHRYPSHMGGRGGRGGGGGGGGAGRGGGGNRGRGRGGYKSLDDVGTGAGRYGTQGNAYQNAQQQQPNYDDGPSNDGRGGGDVAAAYNANFPPLGGGGGLPYGK